MESEKFVQIRSSVACKLKERGINSIEDVKNMPQRFTYTLNWDIDKKVKATRRSYQKIESAVSKNLEGVYLIIARNMFALIDFLNNR